MNDRKYDNEYDEYDDSYVDDGYDYDDDYVNDSDYDEASVLKKAGLIKVDGNVEYFNERSKRNVKINLGDLYLPDADNISVKALKIYNELDEGKIEGQLLSDNLLMLFDLVDAFCGNRDKERAKLLNAPAVAAMIVMGLYMAETARQLGDDDRVEEIEDQLQTLKGADAIRRRKPQDRRRASRGGQNRRR